MNHTIHFVTVLYSAYTLGVNTFYNICYTIEKQRKEGTDGEGDTD